MRGSFSSSASLHFDVRLAQLVLQQAHRLADHLVQIHRREFRGRGAREIQQRVDDLAGAESLLGDLFEQRRFFGVARNLFGEHLRVGGDHGQRRVHFVGHAGGQQSDGAQFVGLHQAALEFGAIRDVLEDDQAADVRPVARDQGRGGDVERDGVLVRRRAGASTNL